MLKSEKETGLIKYTSWIVSSPWLNSWFWRLIVASVLGGITLFVFAAGWVGILVVLGSFVTPSVPVPVRIWTFFAGSLAAAVAAVLLIFVAWNLRLLNDRFSWTKSAGDFWHQHNPRWHRRFRRWWKITKLYRSRKLIRFHHPPPRAAR